MFENNFRGIFLLFMIFLPYGSFETDLNALESKLREYTIVPEILVKMPQHLAKAKFPSGVEVNLGNSIPLKDLQKAPEVHWEHNSSHYYALVITDIDDKANWDPLLREYQLWFVCNIPGDDVSKGFEHLEYIPPIVTEDPHRIAVIVVEQSGFADLNGTEFISPPRHYFAAMEVVYEYKGIEYAANCFNATL